MQSNAKLLPIIWAITAQRLFEAISYSIDRGACQLVTRIVHETVIYRLTIAGGAAGERATECVVAVGTLRHKSSTSVIGHAGEQISLNFTAFPNRHA